MDAIYKQRGESIDYLPSYNVSAGEIVIQNDMVGIAKLDIPANTLGAIALTGVYAINKNSDAGTAINLGQKVYWDIDNGYVTTEPDDGGDPAVKNPYIGKCVKAATDEDVTVDVKLIQ